MKTHLLKLSPALAAAALLSSCANIQDDQTRTRVEGAGAGVVLGAITGGIIGNQYNHHAAEGALIGAAAGGVGGYAIGDHVARKKANYVARERTLDQCISHAERVNANASAYNRTLSRRIDSLQKQIVAAKAKGDRTELKRIKQDLTQLKQETKQQQLIILDEIDDQSNVARKSGSATLRSRVSELRSTQSSLTESQDRLADLGNQIDL
jgi:uncharacterized protein YcfJ